MGRLEDIAARNKKAVRKDGLLMRGIGIVASHGDDKPDLQQGYTLPSQRKPAIARWKIAIATVVVLAIVILIALLRPR
jgi:hypothetical protein